MLKGEFRIMTKKSKEKDAVAKPAAANTTPATTEASKKTTTRAKAAHKPAVRTMAAAATAAAAPVPAPVGAPSSEEIATLAYALWQERGCVDGQAEQDWFRAEQLLRSR